MARSREDVGELTMRIFDRLEHQFPGCEVADALLMVEVVDLDDTVTVEDGTDEGREAPATVMMLEGTTDRLVVQVGMIEFVRRTLFPRDDEVDDDG